MLKVLAAHLFVPLTIFVSLECLTVFYKVEVALVHIHIFVEKLGEVITRGPGLILTIILYQAEFAVNI